MTKKIDPKKELKTTSEVQVKPKSQFLTTVLLSLLLLLTYKYFVDKPKKDVVQKQQEQVIEEAKEQDTILKTDINSIFADIEKEGGVVNITTDKLHGEINLQGAKFDNLILSNYYETSAKKEQIKLLKTGDNPFFVEYGWSANDRSIKLPTNESIWVSDNAVITVNKPATLTWDNEQGLTFTKKISIDKNYMFEIEQSVENQTGKSLSLTPYTKIIKEHPKPTKKRIENISHQGYAGAIDSLLEDKSYKKIKKAKEESFSTDSGWFGFNDKYWFVGSIFDKATSIKTKYEKVNQHDIYEILLEGDIIGLDNSKTISYKSKLFTGAKNLNILDEYMVTENLPQFDKIIDFGWYYFLTKPFYYILNILGNLVVNFGIAILIFTVLLRTALFPIANKSYASMMKMKLMQPKVKQLKEIYGNDKQKMQQKLMALYKKEKISPMGGCLPILIQIPIFFSLYKVLTISIEMRHAPFFGWIQDLSAADPTNIFTLFGLIDWTPPSLLMVGIWPILMGVTMYLQQKMHPKPDDKAQAMAFSLMPFIFTFMLAKLAAGLVIYWTFSNLFAIGQQAVFIKTQGKKK